MIGACILYIEYNRYEQQTPRLQVCSLSLSQTLARSRCVEKSCSNDRSPRCNEIVSGIIPNFKYTYQTSTRGVGIFRKNEYVHIFTNRHILYTLIFHSSEITI